MSENKKQSNHDTKWLIAIVVLVFVVFYGGAGIESRKYEKRQKQEKMRQEQRGDMFARYIIEDIKNRVDLQNIDDKQIDFFAYEYKFDSVLYNKKMDGLIQDSIKYANAIFRDAGMINLLDKDNNNVNISFEDAMKYIDSQQSIHQVVKQKNEIRVEHDDQGTFFAWSESVPGETIVEYNRSKARIIKINKCHLLNLSQELAMRRIARIR